MQRAKQLERDRFYMGLARAVREGANCLGSAVGAVLVVDNRVISTGFNGTPEGFPNCSDCGCVRCRDSWLHATGQSAQVSDPEHVSGRGLDRCICVHAEQNALLTAARFGIACRDATLYTTLSPCFGCLKESIQAGIRRVVFADIYASAMGPALAQQYRDLSDHLRRGDPTNFEQLDPA